MASAIEDETQGLDLFERLFFWNLGKKKVPIFSKDFQC